MSRLDLIVGPNGAGKTTFYERVIAPDRPGLPFVNADRIARDRFGGHVETQSYAAAAIAAQTRAALVAARLDFCTENVFSHPGEVDLITSAVEAGYDVVAHVVMIPRGLSARRVAARAAAGGHSVPEAKLAARYERLWPNVVAVVPYCRLVVFWDNSGDDGPVEVASYRFGLADHPPRWPSWAPEAVLEM